MPTAGSKLQIACATKATSLPKVCTSSACPMTRLHSLCASQASASQRGGRGGRGAARSAIEDCLLYCWGSMTCYVWYTGKETAAGRSLPKKGSAGKAALHRCSSAAKRARGETTLPCLDVLMACNPQLQAGSVLPGQEWQSTSSSWLVHAQESRGRHRTYTSLKADNKACKGIRCLTWNIAVGCNSSRSPGYRSAM